jgi:hypothetical protein
MKMSREKISLNLTNVDPLFCEEVHKDYDAGDVVGFVSSANGNHNALALVADNIAALKRRGIYEPALLQAFTITRTNHAGWSPSVIGCLFALADRAKLLAAGDPLPDGETFTVYRGVRGVGRRRRITTGYSWTLDRGCACWFTQRYTHLPDPAVYEATISRSEVLAYDEGRSEREVICRPHQTRRLRLTAEQICAESDQYRAGIKLVA